MKKPAFGGRASSVACNPILAPSCLIVDAATSHLHLDLLHKKDTETRLRAITYKGGGLSTIKGNFTDLPKFSEFNLSGRGIYLVVNSGGDKAADINKCHAFFVEWDDRSKKDQLHIYKEKFLPEPTFMVDTGGKSIHCYWVLKKPVAAEVWKPIQIRLVDYCKADKNIKDASRCMRLAGFYYVDATGKLTNKSEIINISGKEYLVEDIAQVLPEPKVEAPRYKKKITNSNWTIRDIGEALDAIPQRVSGSNTYEEYRQMAWGLKAIVKDIGLPETVAVDLLEAHSPSKRSGWNIPQVMRSGGERTGAGTFIFIAQKHGWRPSKK
jgi:hypothetical protein